MTQANELQKNINDIVLVARNFIVETPEQVTQASIVLKQCKTRLDEIDATFNPIIEKAHSAHKEALAQKKKHSEPIETAKKHIGNLVAQYQTTQERIRLEQQRIETEKARIQIDEQKITEAVILEQSGMNAEAEAVLNEERPLEIAKVIEQPKIDGMSFRENWCFEIVDITKLPAEYLMANEKAIGAIVRSLKGNAKIAGVRIYTTKTTIQK